MSSGLVSRPHSRGHDAASCSDLALCEGFRVESPDGYVGVVDTLRYTPSTKWDRPSGLAVQAGRSSEMLLIIPLAEVECVYLTERRVVLRPSPRIAATERASTNGHANGNGRVAR